MSYKTKPGYTATNESAISAEVPDEKDGVIAYAEAEGTAWQLSLVSSASLGSDVIATRGGSGRWLKISIGSTSSSAPYLWSLAYQVGTGGASSSLSAGNYTVSTRYELDGQGLLSFSGVRFYWPGGVGAKTIKCALWVTSSASLVASVNVAVNAAGLYVGTFASPYSPSGSDVRGGRVGFHLRNVWVQLSGDDVDEVPSVCPHIRPVQRDLQGQVVLYRWG